MGKHSFEILSINRSEKKGTIKCPVKTINLIEGLGVEGDAHAAPGNRQVSLLAMEDIELMKAKKPDLKPGDFAENITTRGIELYTLPIGTLIEIGECRLRVSKIGKECHHGCEIFQQIGSCIMPKRGIFASVEKGGRIDVESDCYYSK